MILRLRAHVNLYWQLDFKFSGSNTEFPMPTTLTEILTACRGLLEEKREERKVVVEGMAGRVHHLCRDKEKKEEKKK